MKLRVIRNFKKEPYLLRLTLFNIFGYSFKIHCFLMSDIGRSEKGSDILHDHPFDFGNIILWNGYHEITENGTFLRKPGYIGYHKAEFYHRVELLKGYEEGEGETELPCLTLFFTWPKRKNKSWGFKCPNGHVDFKEFHNKGCN